MPGSTPATSQLDWLISITAMIVLFWSRATRDLLKSLGWGIAALHRLHAARKLPSPRRPPHRISRSPVGWAMHPRPPLVLYDGSDSKKRLALSQPGPRFRIRLPPALFGEARQPNRNEFASSHKTRG